MASKLQNEFTYGRRQARAQRSAADLVLLFVLVALAFALIVVLGLQYWYAERIYPGVSVSGVPVGGMSRAEAIERLGAALARQPTPPISVSYNGRVLPVSAGRAAASVDVYDAVSRAYMVGRQGSLQEQMAAQLVTMLAGADVSPDFGVDAAQLRYALSQIASEVRTPARSAIVVDGMRMAAQAGVDVDVDRTLDAILQGLESGAYRTAVNAPLVTLPLQPPPEPTPSAVVDKPNVAGVLSDPLLLKDARTGMEFAIDPASLEAMVYSRQPLLLDDDRVRPLLLEWASQIEIPPQDARLQFDSVAGAVQVVQDSRVGRELDIESTLDSIHQAVSDGSMSAQLVIRDRLPSVDSRFVSQMGIRELVASGTSYFSGSSLARIHNIETAAEKFAGVVVPPNGVFSFNEIVEDVSSANGFEDSLIIWGDRTAVGVGGGVCQVSTTVFRAAYEAGLPIVERYNHGYVVSWYGDPGLDATIYTPSVDFRFRNDTGAYLLIEPVVDRSGGVITFNFYGTKPDRIVTISEPVITDVIEPEAPIYRYDESLGYGEKKQVDWSQKGMTAKVVRTIQEGGETRTETMVSKYQPWRAVFLYGPGADVPVTPTVEPRSDATDAEEASANGVPTLTATDEAGEAPAIVLPTPTPAPTEAPVALPAPTDTPNP